MPIKIIRHGDRFQLVFDTKWKGQLQTLGVLGTPDDGYPTRAEAIAAKKSVTILKSGGITAATLLI